MWAEYNCSQFQEAQQTRQYKNAPTIWEAETKGGYMARVIRNDKDVGNWIESVDLADAPGFKFIFPEFGDSYNVTVEKDAMKVIIARKPAKDFGAKLD